MKLDQLSVGITEWPQLPETVLPGATGTATSRMREFGEIRLRLIEYSPDYLADQWCTKGHIVYAVTGQVIIEQRRGAAFALTAGMSYHVPDGQETAHRIRTRHGATVFIVD